MATTGAKAPKDDNDARADAQRMNSDIQQLREDIAQLTEHLKQTGNRSISRARQAAMDSAEEIQNDMAEMVREKPITALALAAGVGFLFAMMTRR